MSFLSSLQKQIAAVIVPEAPLLTPTLPRLVAEPWYVDHVVVDDQGRVEISGWAFPAPDLPAEEQAERFTLNGESPEIVEYPILRFDVAKVFWQRENAEKSGFKLTADARYPSGVMEIRFHDPSNTTAERGRESCFIPDPALHLNLPDEHRRFRVIGNKDPVGFLSSGCTDAHRIVSAYENATGKSWHDAHAVLDWGVGCGRVARHLAPDLGTRFFGCDIDADNVAWCRANLLGGGGYQPSLLEPPLPYADNSFDVIYGVSVFTHLRANWELRWLEELHRVLRPGGVVLMTVHGQTAIDFAGLTPEVYAALQNRVEQEGLAVTSDNHQLDGFVEHPSEYVNVFHSKRHISSVWGRFFSRITHLQGYIFTHDLIVATKAFRA